MITSKMWHAHRKCKKVIRNVDSINPVSDIREGRVG